MSRDKNSFGKTGGGKPPAPPKATSQRIIEFFGDEPIFSGIHVTVLVSWVSVAQ